MGDITEYSRGLDEPADFILPRVVDKLAEANANDTWITTPKDAELVTGWRDITYQELGHAVNGMAKWTESHLRLGTGSDVVAYIGFVQRSWHCMSPN